MNSSEPQVMQEAKPLAQARLPFNWIEIVAVPVTVSLMETQPIIVILVLLSPIFGVSNSSVPLGDVSITLLLLGLQWWALMVKHFALHDAADTRIRPFHLAGLLLAFVAMLGINSPLMTNIPALFIIGVLVIWCWKRGLDWARTGLSDDHMITTFRAGFFVLLAVLGISIIFADLISLPLFSVLARALPIFFLSGLLGLSFTRIGRLRRENERTSASDSAATRSWLLALTLLWILVTGAALALESFSFQSILAVAPLFWDALGILVTLILYGIYLLLSPIASLFDWLNIHAQLPARGVQGQKPVQLARHLAVSPFPPELIFIGQVVLALVVLVALFFVVRVILRRWRIAHEDEDEEELREALPVQAILQMRREERRKRKRETALALEALDPSSARARYRELLQAMIESDERLARRPDETPVEYQRRLLTIVQKASPIEQDMPADVTILDELTHTYVRERYGGKRTDQSRQGYLRAWVPHLVRRLTGERTTTTPGQPSSQSMKWS